MGNLLASSRRESTKLPFPCISRLATKAFQYVVEPKLVEVLRFTPASPKAAGIKTDTGGLRAPRHETRNRALRNVQAELEQLTMNARRAPERIGECHAADKLGKL